MKINKIAFALSAIGLISLFQNCGQSGGISVYSTNQNQPLDSEQPLATTPTAPLTPSPVLTEIIKIKFTQMAAGQWHTCGISESGGVFCVGSNQFGELGIGTNQNMPRDRFFPVAGLESGVKKIWPSPMWSTCALMNTGDVKCWGRNYAMQLGDGTTEDRWAPVEVLGLYGKVVDIGGNYPCFVLDSGEAQCTPHIQNKIKSSIAGSSIIKIASGNGFTCLLNSVSSVECFGQNRYGVLGNGTQSSGSSQTPTVVKHLEKDVIDLVVASESACALLMNGSVKCWGDNRFGVLGINSLDSSDTRQPGIAIPTLVEGLTEKINSIQSMGGFSVCGISESRKAFCWGGNNGLPQSIKALPVAGIEDVISISIGNSSACFVKSDGSVKCSGTYLGMGPRDLESIPQN